MIYLLTTSAFFIFFGMIGYPLSILFLGKIIKRKAIVKRKDYYPDVTVMVVAHNEEKVIKKKLENIISCDYPKDKFKIIVSSDSSTDKTNSIVSEFIKNREDIDILLYEVKERKGKTNAQNEAQKYVTSEYLLMTDANSLFEENSIKEILSSFYDKDICYVCGQLKYTNIGNTTSDSENTYWNLDLMIREIESEIQTITAGNGALYACRNAEYIDIPPIESHDSAFPFKFAMDGKRAIYNKEAIAYEKSGESINDEFSRKVRMNRIILRSILPSLKILNIYRYKWFTYFYLGHRTARYLLWINHLVLFVSSFILKDTNIFIFTLFVMQSVFYIIGLVSCKFGIKSKLVRMINYYCVAIFAQWCGVVNIVSGKSKPFWEKAESTR